MRGFSEQPPLIRSKQRHTSRTIMSETAAYTRRNDKHIRKCAVVLYVTALLNEL